MTSPLRWVAGTACAVFGATLLIAPHHLLGTAGIVGRGRLDLPGLALVIAGFLLLFVETFQPGRRTTIAIHLGAALVHAWIVWVFAELRAWPISILLATVGLLVGLMPFVGGGPTMAHEGRAGEPRLTS